MLSMRAVVTCVWFCAYLYTVLYMCACACVVEVMRNMLNEVLLCVYVIHTIIGFIVL